MVSSIISSKIIWHVCVYVWVCVWRVCMYVFTGTYHRGSLGRSRLKLLRFTHPTNCDPWWQKYTCLFACVCGWVCECVWVCVCVFCVTLVVEGERLALLPTSYSHTFPPPYRAACRRWCWSRGRSTTWIWRTSCGAHSTVPCQT